MHLELACRRKRRETPKTTQQIKKTKSLSVPTSSKFYFSKGNT
jgi:hypothetical protein